MFLLLLVYSCTSYNTDYQKVTLDISVDVFSTTTSEKMKYWDTQRKGANSVRFYADEEFFKNANRDGLEFLRLNLTYLSENSYPLLSEDANFQQNYSFLIGDVNNYQGIRKGDLKQLITLLDLADKYDVKIILTMFDLPGHKYGNPSEEDLVHDLWTDEKYWVDSFNFWRELALNVKDHPAIAAYNPINEPTTAHVAGFDDMSEGFKLWLKRIEGTTADLNLFNKLMVAAIREVDKEMPIVLDGYLWTDPNGLPYTEVIQDKNILYAFHNPGPYNFTSFRANRGRYSYPDNMPSLDGSSKWTISMLEKSFDPVYKFMKNNNIDKSQIIASEFWCDRRISGCAEYLNDLIQIYNKNEMHWSFWEYQGQGAWTGYEYQRGSKRDRSFYKQAVYKKEDYNKFKDRSDSSIWSVIQKGLGNTGNLKDSDLVNKRFPTDYLIDLLSDKSWENKNIALDNIRTYGNDDENIFKILIPLLSNEEWKVQLFTVQAFGTISMDRTIIIPELITLLTNEEWQIREAAVETLGLIGPGAINAVPGILELLGDEEWRIQLTSIVALEQITKYENDLVNKRVKKMRFSDEDQVSRASEFYINSL